MILHSRQAILTTYIMDDYYHYYDLYAKHSFFAEALVITFCDELNFLAKFIYKYRVTDKEMHYRQKGFYYQIGGRVRL